MRKIQKNQMIQDTLSTVNRIKNSLGEELDITILDYMAIATLEKLGVAEKQIKKLYQEG